jgi:hypothetical protein
MEKFIDNGSNMLNGELKLRGSQVLFLPHSVHSPQVCSSVARRKIGGGDEIVMGGDEIVRNG